MAERVPLDLTWRAGLSTNELLLRLYNFSFRLDTERTGQIEFANSTARDSLAFGQQLVGHTNISYTYWHRLSNKKERRVTTPEHLAFYARLARMIEETVGRVSAQEFTNFRQDFYLQFGTMRPAVLRTCLDTLALTIGVHPWALGVIPDEDGRVLIGAHITIITSFVQNIFRAGNASTGQDWPHTFPDTVMDVHRMPKDHALKPGTYDIVFRSAVPRAVIVVEHGSFDWGKRTVQRNFADCVVILTKGRPSLAIREFLHLLWVRLRDKPTVFLYYGDHDQAGFHIYLTLKRGNKASAWGNKYLVCPSLQFCTPDKAQVLAHHRRYVDTVWRNDLRHKYPLRREGLINNNCEAEYKRRKNIIQQRMIRRLNGNDRRMYTANKAFNLASTEPELLQHVEDARQRSDSRYSLTICAAVSYTGGMENYIVTHVNTVTNTTAVTQTETTAVLNAPIANVNRVALANTM